MLRILLSDMLKNHDRKDVVEELARGAISDDIKGKVRQIVKNGGREQMRRDFAKAANGADSVKAVQTPRGIVHTAELEDGTTISARGFSSTGRPSIQVNDQNANQIVKVRYEQ